MTKNIKISETVEPQPSKTKRITAYVLLVIIIISVFFTIKKFGIQFLTFFIFILLLLLPVFITFETDITKFLGIDREKVDSEKDKLKQQAEDAYDDYSPKISSNTYKWIVVFIVSVALLVSLILIITSKNFHKSKISNLIVSNLILINCGALISYTFI